MAGEATRADRLVRRSMAVVVVAVAVVAAYTSYLHTVAVVVEHGEAPGTARLIPVTTDGLILAAGLVMVHSARTGLATPRLARIMLGAGIAATLASNAMHGAPRGVVGSIVAAWPAATFVGVSELALWLMRASGRVSAPDAPTAISAAPARSDVKADITTNPAESYDWLPDMLPARTTDRRNDGAFPAVAALDIDRPAMVTAPASDRSHLDAVRKWLADNPAMSGAEIARRLDVSERTGRRLRAAATTSN